MPIPESMADVTPEWLLTALLDDGRIAAPLTGVRIEPLAASTGLIGDLAIVHLETATTAGEQAHSHPERLALKLPAANRDSRRIGAMLNAYGREAAFYADVAPTSSHAPACFLNISHADTDRHVLAIEFIDADPFDPIVGASEAQAIAGVDALAALHGDWWGGAVELGWMPGFDRGGVGGLAPLWEQNLPAFVERYRDSLPGDTARRVLGFAPHLAAWSASAANGPLTLVHADYRLDNLLFRGDQVTIIDWQTAMRAPAAMDLSCFLATSLSVEQRRESEAALIERYLGVLAARGIDVDADWFASSYDENLLWWMGQFGNNLAHLDPGDDAVQEALTTMVERVFWAGYDHDVG